MMVYISDMAKSSALNTLLELSTTKADDAAKRLGQANAAVKSEEEKLRVLQGYLDEYDERFKLSMSKGLSPVMYQNYQQFMVKMQAAVNGQKQAVTNALKRVEDARRKWQESEKEKMSYTTLLRRADQTAKNKELKRDQKDTDERAARLSYKRN